MGTRRNSNWKYHNCSIFERTPPAHIETDYPNSSGGPDAKIPDSSTDQRYWTLAGALYDHEGLLAGVHGDYLIFDHPFLDFELTNRRPVVPGSKTIATSNKFAGCHVFATDTQLNRYSYNEPITFVRLASNWTDYAIWQIKDGALSDFFPNMRHAAFLIGGRYRVYNQERMNTPNSQRYGMDINNGNAETDRFVVAIPWSGTVAPVVHVGRRVDSNTLRAASTSDITNGEVVVYTEAANRDAMVSTPRTFWRDTATNQLWIHYQGGIKRTGTTLNEDQENLIGVTPA
jgi:hypothetical protein